MFREECTMLEIATRFVLAHSSHDAGATRHADRRRVVVATNIMPSFAS